MVIGGKEKGRRGQIKGNHTGKRNLEGSFHGIYPARHLSCSSPPKTATRPRRLRIWSCCGRKSVTRRSSGGRSTPAALGDDRLPWDIPLASAALSDGSNPCLFYFIASPAELR